MEDSPTPTPLPGDLVIIANMKEETYPNISDGSIGVLDGMIGVPKEEYLVTFNPDTPFRDRGYVSTSGGPAFYLPASILKYSGPAKRRYWKWKNGISRKDRGEEYVQDTHVFTLDWSSWSNHP